MGFLKRMFKKDKPAGASIKAGRRPNAQKKEEDIPDCKIGLTGEFDESGLAKRVALAFDETDGLDDVETLWVAQLSSKVVLKGKVPSQAILDQMVSVAKGIDGATAVDTSEVEVG